MMNLVSQEKIRVIFLKKLSIEMIKRGANNSTIQKTLDEADSSLSEYISEMEITNLESLERSFGTTQQYCNENMINFNREGFLLQMFSSLIFLLSMMTIFSFGLSFITFWQFIRGHALSMPPDYALMQISSGINGFLGTLFCLSVLLWILNRYYSKSFSPVDLRSKILRKTVLILYWYLVILCVSMFIYLYSKAWYLLPLAWKQNMNFLIIEGLVRWFLLLVYFVITAILYSIKFVKSRDIETRKKNDSFAIDKLDGLVTFFALIIFIVPQPGIGLLILILGIGTILTNNITIKNWILGSLSICGQIAIILITSTSWNYPSELNKKIIVFGIKITIGSNDTPVLIAFIFSLFLLVLWTTICLIIIRNKKLKKKYKLILKKNSDQYLSVILVILVGVSLLGSQPQDTLLPSVYEYQIDPINSIYTLEERVWIPRKGKIFVSFVDYINVTFWDLNTNGSKVNITSNVINGNWSLTWRNDGEIFFSFFKLGFFNLQQAPGFVFNEYETFNITKSYWFYEIEAKNSGILKYNYEIYFDIRYFITPSLSYRWKAKSSWFPFYVEPVSAGIVFIFLFIEFDEKKKIKKK